MSGVYVDAVGLRKVPYPLSAVVARSHVGVRVGVVPDERACLVPGWYARQQRRVRDVPVRAIEIHRAITGVGRCTILERTGYGSDLEPASDYCCTLLRLSCKAWAAAVPAERDRWRYDGRMRGRGHGWSRKCRAKHRHTSCRDKKPNGTLGCLGGDHQALPLRSCLILHAFNNLAQHGPYGNEMISEKAHRALGI